MKTGFANQCQRGLSLIELMVAMVLGLLVVGAIIQLFIGTRVTYNVTSGLARVQENARFAMEIMNRDIRMAGAGEICGGREPVQSKVWVDPGDDGINQLLNFNLSVRGWEYTGSGTSPGTGDNATVDFDPESTEASSNHWSDGSGNLPAVLMGFARPALPYSDVLGIRTSDPGANVTGCPGTNNSTKSENVHTCAPPDGNNSANHGVQQGDLFAVVDCRNGFMEVCRHTAKMQAAALVCSNGGGNKKTGGEWFTLYHTQMELHRPSTIFYFVAESASGDGRRALYRAINCSSDFDTPGSAGCRLEELVEGVESLQLFYRVAGDETLYTANQIPGNDWGDVNAVVMHLIVASPEQVDARELNQTLTLDNGLVFNVNDRRVRQVYSNTVAIRNAITVH